MNLIKIISKILDYIPVVFFLIFSFIGLALIADLNHIDIPNPVAFLLLVMIMHWHTTLGILFFISGIGVANLFYKWKQK
jgi:uncharacterized membrane protein